jgi:predicted RNase H-like HicB family nuclease
MNYLVVYEPTPTGWSAYVPDLPGCVATGRTREQTHQQIREAIDFHLEGLRGAGQPVPQPSSVADVVEVAG